MERARLSHFDRNEREIEFGRALAFSDGVFAFAITLLVVSIDVPQISGSDVEDALLRRLDELLPFVFSYFLSFAIVGLLWLRHHRLFSRIRKLDTHALVVNLVLLSFVALMPFSTEVLGRYGDTPAGASIYAANLAIAVAGYTWLWWHCSRAGMLDEHPTPRQLRLELVTRLIPSVGFLLSIPVAFAASALVAQIMWGVTTALQQALFRRYLREGRILAEDRDED
jgi:uncharacterized membrane protein